MQGGTPSMIAPTPLQCDSPNVVTRKTSPKLEPGIGAGRGGRTEELMRWDEDGISND